MDDPGIIKHIYDIARIAAEQQIKVEHLLQTSTTRNPGGVALTA
jgi:hypothetical protein